VDKTAAGFDKQAIIGCRGRNAEKKDKQQDDPWSHNHSASFLFGNPDEHSCSPYFTRNLSSELLHDRGIEGVHVKRCGISDVFVEQGRQDELRKKYLLDQ